MKQKYLCYHDYGQGAVWIYVFANTKGEIENLYPELTITDKAPDWLKDSARKKMDENLTYDIEDQPSGVLEAIIESRN